MAEIIQKDKLEGNFVTLREVRVDDAQFILDLRCSPKARFLNPTQNNLELQKQYICNYLKKQNEWYFIIEDKSHNPLGTIRIYNVKNDSFEAGSWLMNDKSSMQQSIEGEYLLKRYAYEVLGLHKNCFSVKKSNKSVIRFHMLYGATIINENNTDYFFELTKEQFNKNSEKILTMIYS